MQNKLLLIVLGMAAVTFLCRALPFMLLGRVRFGSLGAAWVRYLPIAILSACVFPQLLFPETQSGSLNLPALAALPTAVAGFLTRNLLAAVLVGVSSLALLRTTF